MEDKSGADQNQNKTILNAIVTTKSKTLGDDNGL